MSIATEQLTDFSIKTGKDQDLFIYLFILNSGIKKSKLGGQTHSGFHSVFMVSLNQDYIASWKKIERRANFPFSSF